MRPTAHAEDCGTQIYWPWMRTRCTCALTERQRIFDLERRVPDVGEPERAGDGALVWERFWEEEYVEGRGTGAGYNPTAGRPVAARVPADGLEIDEARWLAAALLAAADEAEG